MARFEEEVFNLVGIDAPTSDDLTEEEHRSVEGGIAGAFLGGGDFSQFPLEGGPDPSRGALW